VASAVMRTLSKDPRQRYFTTKSVRQEIESWPLAESLRFDPVHPESEVAQAAKVALDSYSRCLGDQSFLTRFYERLRGNPAISDKLGSMMFDSQVELIKPAIRHLLEAARGQEDSRGELDRMGGRHASYGLTEDHLRTFVDTLIEVAVELDGADASDRLRAAWQAATEAGLRHFAEAASIARAPTPLRSGVVPRREPAEQRADRGHRAPR
jgi:hypothetical protein